MKISFFSFCTRLLFCLSLFLHFYKLTEAPPLFYWDEQAGSAHVACLVQTGKNAVGDSMPAYSFTSYAGGRSSPVYTMVAWGWAEAFGFSPQSLRTLSGIFAVLALLGLLLLVRQVKSRWLAESILLIWALSPWMFQSYRIAWDPPLAATLLVWSVYLYLKKGSHWAMLSGVCAGFAAHTYPPLIVQVPLLFAGIFVLRYRLRFSRPFSTAAIQILPFTALLVPLILNPPSTLRNRIATVTMIDVQRPQSLDLGKQLANFSTNMMKQLSPNFIFIEGDFNLRHSIPDFGLASSLEAFSWLMGVPILIILWCSVRNYLSRQEKLLLGIALTGFVSGMIPAALTNDSIPHALRSIGASPFLVLCSAFFLAIVLREVSWSRWPILLIAFYCVATFFPFYFRHYPQVSMIWFSNSEWRRASEFAAKDDYAGWMTLPENTRVKHSIQRMYIDMYMFGRPCRPADMPR